MRLFVRLDWALVRRGTGKLTLNSRGLSSTTPTSCSQKRVLRLTLASRSRMPSVVSLMHVPNSLVFIWVAENERVISRRGGRAQGVLCNYWSVSMVGRAVSKTVVNSYPRCLKHTPGVPDGRRDTMLHSCFLHLRSCAGGRNVLGLSTTVLFLAL